MKEKRTSECCSWTHVNMRCITSLPLAVGLGSRTAPPHRDVHQRAWLPPCILRAQIWTPSTRLRLSFRTIWLWDLPSNSRRCSGCKTALPRELQRPCCNSPSSKASRLRARGHSQASVSLPCSQLAPQYLDFWVSFLF